MIPSSVVHQPNPVEPEPGPVASIPEPIEPGPVAAVTEPAEPNPSPVVPDFETESKGSGSVTSAQPKYDVAGFLAHARSVMAGRCGSDVAKRDRALKKKRFRLQEANDPASADLIQAEIDQVADGPNYFLRLMREAKND